MSTSDALSRLRAGLDRDEQIAQAAINPAQPGTHWCWETTHDGMPVPSGEEVRVLEDGHHLSLRTVEEFPLSWSPSNTLPAFIIGADRGFPGSLRHIARHDPARVLRQVAAIRRAIDEELENQRKFDAEFGCVHDVEDIAAGRCPAFNSPLLKALADIYPTETGGPT